MGVRAVHRATDTAGVCGVGRTPRAGVAVFPECPRAGSLRDTGGVFCVQPRVAGAGEGAIPNGDSWAEQTFPDREKFADAGIMIGNWPEQDLYQIQVNVP